MSGILCYLSRGKDITAAKGFCLAGFGIIVLVFQFGIGGRLLGLPGPGSAVFGLVPVLVFAVAFGLSMDYEVFLLSRIKERFDETRNNDRATLDGLTATASTITSPPTTM